MVQGGNLAHLSSYNHSQLIAYSVMVLYVTVVLDRCFGTQRSLLPKSLLVSLGLDIQVEQI